MNTEPTLAIDPGASGGLAFGCRDHITAEPMFNFGHNCGFVRGAAMGLGFRVELVRPQKWQKHFSLGTIKDAGGKGPWKRKLKEEAQRRFPTAEITLKTADAVLILDWALNANGENH